MHIQKILKMNFFALIIVLFTVPQCSSDSSAGTGTPVIPGDWEYNPPSTASKIIDHSAARLPVLESITDAAINKAKSDLIIAYGHTSHGSQIVDGVYGLETWKGEPYQVSNSASTGELELRDSPFTGASDLGNPDRTSWESATRTYLNSHAEVNVVIWSWCGQVGSSSESDIANYLSLMSGLESDFPDVKFVYMTGHLDGSGLAGNLHIRNEQIRTYCRTNGKWLFDFADIESYGPDGVYYGNKNADDACNYDGGNWAQEWQNSHSVNVDWYDCSSAHSEAVNANLKAYAFWWLMARLAENL